MHTLLQAIRGYYAINMVSYNNEPKVQSIHKLSDTHLTYTTAYCYIGRTHSQLLVGDREPLTARTVYSPWAGASLMITY